ncbi:CAP-associated domain-containing protein [Siminovitchia sediminis]|uniref:CAP-associated domain-containing protein n=1 Tax=Siminovitchia sediminis TaxID=1274353 RepID=A0ABW4KH09_9BACI
MNFIRVILLCLAVGGFILYQQGNEQVVAAVQNGIKQFRHYAESIANHPKVSDWIGDVETGLQSLENKMKGVEPPKEVESPVLSIPEEQAFSIHNIEIGDTKENVENHAGPAVQSTYNEYGVKWFTYHENYQNFFMAAYNKEGKVSGLYTNQDVISSKLDIHLSDSKESVVQKLGEPLTGIRKGFVLYQVQNPGEYHTYELDNSYITVFYDKHEGDTVTALQIISKSLEDQKTDYFGISSNELKEGFEYQLFDLVNASRVHHGLHPLSWDDRVKVTAREHSADMAENQYFSHDNLKGQSPFDRLEEDQIWYRAAGENIAMGQVSSIFAHEGLMNSIGHRKNILSPDFHSLGTGVAFDSQSRPYYTEKFIGK